jgi:threonine/homoserine/homoserine lactone efflux protein
MGLTELFIASLPFAWFMAVSSITPGPNNLMLAASGMNYGFRRTIPHMLGVAFGFGFFMLMCLFGIGALYNAFPQIHIFMNIFAALYMAYLAYKIAMSSAPKSINTTKEPRPMNFFEAAAFQFVNPKAIVMGLASISAFIPAGTTLGQQIFIIAVMVFAINLPCVGVWTGFGQAMARLFTTEKTRRIVNIVLALLLLATIPMIMH